MPSSTMLKPWLYASVAPFFISGITACTTEVLLVGREVEHEVGLRISSS